MEIHVLKWFKMKTYFGACPLLNAALLWIHHAKLMVSSDRCRLRMVETPESISFDPRPRHAGFLLRGNPLQFLLEWSTSQSLRIKFGALSHKAPHLSLWWFHSASADIMTLRIKDNHYSKENSHEISWWMPRADEKLETQDEPRRYCSG